MEAKELRIGNIVTINNPESWKDLKYIPMRVIGINQCLGINDMPTYCVSMMVLDNLKINKYTFQIFSQFIEFIEPITLTEEILLKCKGFYEEEKKESKEHSNYFSIGIYDYKYCFSYAYFREDWSVYIEYTDSPFECDDNKKYIITTGIKYVHQLQNLYYALTNEELEIQL